MMPSNHNPLQTPCKCQNLKIFFSLSVELSTSNLAVLAHILRNNFPVGWGVKAMIILITQGE